MPGFNGKQPFDLLGRPIYEGDLVQYGARTGYVLLTLEDRAMLVEYDRDSTRPEIGIEQTWLYAPMQCVLRTGALSPIR